MYCTYYFQLYLTILYEFASFVKCSLCSLKINVPSTISKHTAVGCRQDLGRIIPVPLFIASVLFHVPVLGGLSQVYGPKLYLWQI